MSTKSKSYKKFAPKVYIRTFGCQMNERDTEALAGLFLADGYTLAKNEAEADLILVNTCSVRAHAENRAISLLGSLKKLRVNESSSSTSKRNKKSNSSTRQLVNSSTPIVGLIGCMAKNRGEELFKKMPYINLVVSPAKLYKIPEYIERIQVTRSRGHKVTSNQSRIIDAEDGVRKEEFYEAAFRVEPNHAQVVVSTGCSNFCSYCVVPNVRGLLRLRKPSDIIDEVKRNVDLGIRKITLLGQNVNDYFYESQDIPSRAQARHKSQVNFIDLLRKVIEFESVEEVDFISTHPKNTSKELFTLMAESDKIKKHLHLPFQSGSNRILKMMNRGHTREKYLKLIDNYRKIVDGTLSTDVIVGFPCETAKDFRQTKDILEKVRFNYAYIFKYSPRPHTKAAQMSDDVPDEVKKERHQILLNLQKSISKNKCRTRK